MANIFSFGSYIPVIDESSFIHPQASVIGNVIIGKRVYIGPGAVLRGDWGEINIADGCNVQENCVLHMFPGVAVTLEEGAHIGHGAVVHGARIGKNAMVGMNSVVMDNAEIGEETIIGALTLVPAQTIVPAAVIFVGNPGRILKAASREMIEWKKQGTALYQSLPEQCFSSMQPVAPLREVPKDRPMQAKLYQTWEESKAAAITAARGESSE